MSNNKNKDFPQEDPYQVLGVRPDDNVATIQKAYRKLALQLHPDKIQQLSAAEQTVAAARFQTIQIAKAFLTEPEFAQARASYDLQRASQLRREQVEAERTQHMSDQRKRMRDDLVAQEKDARKGKHANTTKIDYKQKVQELRKEGEQLRQQYAEKEAAKMAAKASNNEDRQIRLKWSRKKLQVSPTEHSIADWMQPFGSVESVEFLGAKGNAALVTFTDPASCRPCVDRYADSEEMRASYVGKRKEMEESNHNNSRQKEEENDDSSLLPNKTVTKDWKIQRAAEREKVLREMELQELGAPKRTRKKMPHVFPPSLSGDKNPLPLLQEQETLILKNFFTSEEIKAIQLVI